MATETAQLAELVEFLHHGNSELRKIAIDNLAGYSQSRQAIFKTNNLRPVQDLKLLLKDYPDANEPNVQQMVLLLANLGKDEKALRLLKFKRDTPKPLSTSPIAIDQLMDCFVKGADGSYNASTNYDYLSYFFADLAKTIDESVIPLTKLIVFTEHKSHVRRLGVASTIKNVAFDIDSHPALLAPHYALSSKPLLTITSDGQTQDDAEPEINILPYVLLPLCGPEEFNADDADDMLEDLQLLASGKKREADPEIIKTHLDTLLLLTTTRQGRDTLRKIKVYPVIRELHLAVAAESVGEGCDRLVQIIMRDEEGEGNNNIVSSMQLGSMSASSEFVQETDSDNEVVEVA